MFLLTWPPNVHPDRKVETSRGGAATHEPRVPVVTGLFNRMSRLVPLANVLPEDSADVYSVWDVFH